VNKKCKNSSSLAKKRKFRKKNYMINIISIFVPTYAYIYISYTGRAAKNNPGKGGSRVVGIPS
jgi:hypothetical protein